MWGAGRSDRRAVTGCEAASVRTDKEKADRFKDEDHLETIRQHRGPSDIYPWLDDPL